MYVRMYVCTHVRRYLRSCIRTYVYTYTCTYPYPYTYIWQCSFCCCQVKYEGRYHQDKICIIAHFMKTFSEIRSLQVSSRVCQIRCSRLGLSSVQATLNHFTKDSFDWGHAFIRNRKLIY